MHSHLAVESSPQLQGSNDGNSLKGLVLPFLRALDSMNTHDDGFSLAIAGGVTTSLILPGSADAMGMLVPHTLLLLYDMAPRWTGLCYQTQAHPGEIVISPFIGTTIWHKWLRGGLPYSSSLETHEVRHSSSPIIFILTSHLADMHVVRRTHLIFWFKLLNSSF